MPLPPALLKRLAKRGLVDKSVKQKTLAAAAPAEEIIAEDYDDIDDEPRPFEYDYEYQSKQNRPRQPQNFWSERLKKRIVDGSINGYKGCPNKYNIHHKCSSYCVNTFGDGIKEPLKSYAKRKIRLLRRYALPNDWKEVYDDGLGVHYYWNTVDDTVSWLPPSHPKCVITKSAAILRKELEAAQPEQDENDDEHIQQQHHQPMEGIESSVGGGGGDGYSSDSNQAIVRETLQQQQPPKQPVKKPKARDLDKVLRTKSERRSKRDAMGGALDPMDPAAYSDVPRGKWSAGLEHENTKTGVDSTVSGTNFQMRPYPAPGAVLRANAQKNQDDDSDKNSDNDDN